MTTRYIGNVCACKKLKHILSNLSSQSAQTSRNISFRRASGGRELQMESRIFAAEVDQLTTPLGMVTFCHTFHNRSNAKFVSIGAISQARFGFAVNSRLMYDPEKLLWPTRQFKTESRAGIVHARVGSTFRSVDYRRAFSSPDVFLTLRP